MKLKDAIVLYRAKNRMSMQAFAEKCGVTAQTIYNVETVGQKPSRVTKAKIEIVLGDEYQIDEENEE
jgi:DNA-binding XRE family transcriptional regulator